MLIYIVVFIISLWGVREADVRYEERSYRILFSLIAVLPPILLAGFRDSTVGTDMVIYILPLFEEQAIAQQELGTFIDTNDLEILYLILNYIVAKITDSPFVLLLLIHTLIIIPLYITAMKWRELLSPVLFMFVFYMIFFALFISMIFFERFFSLF